MGKELEVRCQQVKGFEGLKNETWFFRFESGETANFTQDILALLYQIYYVPGHEAPSMIAEPGTRPTDLNPKNIKRRLSSIFSKPNSPLPSRHLTQTGSVDPLKTAKLESKSAAVVARGMPSESAFVLIGITKEALFNHDAQAELSVELMKLHQLYPNTKVGICIFNKKATYTLGEINEEKLRELKGFSLSDIQGINRSRTQLLRMIDGAKDYIRVMIANVMTEDAGDRKTFYLHSTEGTDWLRMGELFKSAFKDLEIQTDIGAGDNFHYLEKVFRLSTAQLPAESTAVGFELFEQEEDRAQTSSGPVMRSKEIPVPEPVKTMRFSESASASYPPGNLYPMLPQLHPEVPVRADWPGYPPPMHPGYLPVAFSQGMSMTPFMQSMPAIPSSSAPMPVPSAPFVPSSAMPLSNAPVLSQQAETSASHFRSAPPPVLIFREGQAETPEQPPSYGSVSQLAARWEQRTREQQETQERHMPRFSNA